MGEQEEERNRSQYLLGVRSAHAVVQAARHGPCEQCRLLSCVLGLVSPFLVHIPREHCEKLFGE